MNNTNIITNSASFDSMDDCLRFDDDCLSLMSTSSADAALKLLEESSTSIHVGEVIDMTAYGDDDDDDSVEILEPPSGFRGGNEASQWESVFSPAEEIAKLQKLSNNVSEDWSQAEQESVSSYNGQSFKEDIASLMTGEIIEPPELSATTFNTEDAQPQQQRHLEVQEHHAAPRASTMKAQPTNQLPETLQRIVGYIAHTEPDRQVVLQVEGIIRHCQDQQQRGKHKYQNLSGSIMEHLVDFYGGSRFREIYQASLEFDPSKYARQRALREPPAAMDAPDALQLAIAYGMHLARLDQRGQESSINMVQNGVESLNSMSEADRQAFWSYMVNQQG